jgi:hypothetical protein
VLALATVLAALYVGINLGRLVWTARSGERLADHVTASPTAPSASPEHSEAGGASQILFGDLHVHTSYSADAQLMGVLLAGREPDRGPMDACDFARFCSQLDFWSINDHAESFTPARWQSTVEAIRECNAISGDRENPDLVSYLGWEWSHAGATPETHYGHKNVVLRGTSDAEIPTRPIASRPGPPYPFMMIGLAGPFMSGFEFSDFADFYRYAWDALDVEDCAKGVPVRDLPADCRESATTPAELFSKLDDWALPALVIPHGLAWGTTNPPGARLDLQLSQHDSERQRLLEVYSGHGNSEVYRDLSRPPAGSRCPPPDENDDVELCCQRASKVARAHCATPGSKACDELVESAVKLVTSRRLRQTGPTSAVPGSTVEEWGRCGQLGDSEFLPAFNYRPKQSAQYSLAVGSRGSAGESLRYQWGFIGSSDNHRGRAGPGYKEFGRQIMSDGVGYPIPADYQDGRSASFYYTGGLAAVHASARDRNAIFTGLERRETYATSGDRILLWFDWLEPDGSSTRPMGSVIDTDGEPRFRVRAAGAFEQLPGCPDFVHASLSPDRIESLCLGECFHPSATRKRIERIEVVRIRPGEGDESSIASRIEDPWRIFECPDDPSGCTFEFSDSEFTVEKPETTYYVRAIQVPSLAVNGDPLRCERDEKGRCVRSRPCGNVADGSPDDCLAMIGERAWSSPIFLRARDGSDD